METPLVEQSIDVILNTTAESTEHAKEILDALIAGSPKWALFCGTIAPVVTSILRLSPIPTVIKFVTRGSVGSLPLMPYTALVCDSVLWMLFGFLIQDMKILFTHILGVLFTLTYSFFYATTYRKSGDLSDLTILPGTLGQHGIFILSILCISLLIIITFPHYYARQTIGFAADFGSIFMYSGPMAAVRAVLREKNAASLPLPFTIMCFLNGFCWFVYGWFVLRDVILWGPSIIGVFLSTTQLFLICYFGSRDEVPSTEEAEHIETVDLKDTEEEYGEANEVSEDDIDYDDYEDDSGDDREKLISSKEGDIESK